MEIVQGVKKLNSISRERLNFRRRPILCTTLYRNPMQASNFSGTFDQLFLRIFYKVFTEDASLSLLYHGAKKSKWPKTQIKGSCAGGLAPWRHRYHGDKMAPICLKMVQSVNDWPLLALTLLKRWKVFFFGPCCIYADRKTFRTDEKVWKEPLLARKTLLVLIPQGSF